MIKGIATEGFKPGHLIDRRGDFLNIPGCQSISDGEGRLFAMGNQQIEMNYILSVTIEGETGNVTAKGQPVKLKPEP